MQLIQKFREYATPLTGLLLIAAAFILPLGLPGSPNLFELVTSIIKSAWISYT